MIRIDAALAFPAIGDQRPARSRRMIQAGDVVAFRGKRRISRLEVVSEEHGLRVDGIRQEHLPRLVIQGNRLDLVRCRKDKLVAENIVPGSFPPTGAELPSLRAGVIQEEMSFGQWNLD